MGAKMVYDDPRWDKVGLTKSARYVGPMLYFKGGFTEECNKRIKQAWMCFNMCRRFWVSDSPLEFRVNIFVASVLRVPISGAVAFARHTSTICWL